MTSRPYLAPGQRLYLARDPQSPRPRSTEPAALGFVQTAETIRVPAVPTGTQPPLSRNYIAGLRGAPPNPCLAADYVGEGSARPQSAIAALNSPGGGSKGGSRRPPLDTSRPIPEPLRKHIETSNFSKQLTRDQWTSIAIR